MGIGLGQDREAQPAGRVSTARREEGEAVGDVTNQITGHLMDAAKLAIEAGGNWTGKYAIIAQMVVDADGTFTLTWERYGPNEMDNRSGGQP